MQLNVLLQLLSVISMVIRTRKRTGYMPAQLLIILHWFQGGHVALKVLEKNQLFFQDLESP